MPHGIYENIECDVGKHPEFTPQAHQAELLDYFLNRLKYKGIVAFHRLGSGKSCSSILISDGMIRAAKVKKVFVLTPGSLRQNFIEEYCEKCGYKPKYLRKYYTFITTNYSVGNRLPDFNGSLVIIDEVHNLINGVKNQSKHATLIYNALMNTDCKILALTGTPVFNNIWEWPFLGNLLKPGTFTRMIRGNELDKEAFMTKFIINENGEVKPKKPKNFTSKLRGIISYFPGIAGGFYPKVIHETPIQVRMTKPQDATYWAVADWENTIRNMGPPARSSKEYATDMMKFIMCSKYIMSRFFSNFYYPTEPVNYRSSTSLESRDEVHHVGKIRKYVYKPTGEVADNKKYFVDKLDKFKLLEEKMANPGLSKSKLNAIYKKIMRKSKEKVDKNVVTDYVLKNIGWVDKKQFSGHKLTDVYSRKFAAIITNIVGHWKAKHVVFTFFKTKAGVNMLHALFKMCGIRTEIYSGDISEGKRKSILKEFNSEKNRYGDKIKALLVTEAGAEGINILEAQHMHIVESSTREMKLQQAIGRVVRYKSHMVDGRKPMPKNEQVVHIWRYWSTSSSDPFTLVRFHKDSQGVTKKTEKTIVDKTTVDEILYQKGQFHVNSMQSFLDLLKQASVTKYDKNQDKDNRLPDYKIHPVSPELEKAYKISDQRYENSKPDVVKDVVIDTSLVKDIEKSADEDSDGSPDQSTISKTSKKSKTKK